MFESLPPFMTTTLMLIIFNQYIKKNLAANFETLTQRISDDVNHLNLEEEDFHEFLRGYTVISAKI